MDELRSRMCKDLSDAIDTGSWKCVNECYERNMDKIAQRQVSDGIISAMMTDDAIGERNYPIYMHYENNSPIRELVGNKLRKLGFLVEYSDPPVEDGYSLTATHPDLDKLWERDTKKP